jgi:hypothetical protein
MTKPYTLHTLQPTPYTRNPEPETRNSIHTCRSIIKTTWLPVVEWNQRGGLDMIAYYIAIRPSGGSYGEVSVFLPR